MKLTCAHCKKPMGLGILSKTFMEGWRPRVYRFCSMSCRNEFSQKRDEDRDRLKAVASLYRHPT